MENELKGNINVVNHKYSERTQKKGGTRRRKVDVILTENLKLTNDLKT